jgi:acetyl-CoA synthetase
VFWCTADVGWVTGHSYVAYGPLANGATVVMYEGAPTFPDGGRFWKICEKHGVTIFYTAPTAIRALMKLGDEHPGRLRPLLAAPARQRRRADQSRKPGCGTSA